jgi:hypothetical protein
MFYLRYLLIASSVFATRTYISTLGPTTRSLPLESPSSGTSITERLESLLEQVNKRF